MRAVLFAACLLFPSPATAAVPAIVGTATVIDGDTLEIQGQRIRLYGIDAPESEQLCRRQADRVLFRCGEVAARLLAHRVGADTVACIQRDKDRYHRIISVCKWRGLDLSAWMVANGQAMAYRQYSADYVQVENAARAAHLGIWSTEFLPPWQWRATQRVNAEMGR